MTQEEIKYHNRLWYYKTYNQLIDKCIQMEKDGYPEGMYTEVHHILPKCQGGTDEKCNLVRMPVKYHITAHLLLSCTFPDSVGLLNAAILMTTTREGVRVSLITAARLRTEYSNIQKGKVISEETRRKMSESRKGKAVSKDTRKKISMSELGKFVSIDQRRNIMNSLPPTTEHRREKLSEVALKRMKDENNRKNISKTLKNGNKVFGRKSILGPDGIIYKSITDCAKLNNVSTYTVRQWINNSEKEFKFIESTNNDSFEPKRIIGPDGTIYNSLNECSKLTKHSKKSIRRWIDEFPEKGFRFYTENDNN